MRQHIYKGIPLKEMGERKEEGREGGWEGRQLLVNTKIFTVLYLAFLT